MAKWKRGCLQNSYAGVRFPLKPPFAQKLLGQNCLAPNMNNARAQADPEGIAYAGVRFF